ncbi:MAG: AmmeMemoRadiSam system protein B [Phycisphaerales bacterium JB039]
MTGENPHAAAGGPQFDPQAPHHQRPKLRQIRGFAAQANNSPALGLADARQISQRIVFTSPAAQHILPLMDGERSVDDIVAQIGRGLERRSVEMLVAQLDDAGLLHGPKFDELWEEFTSSFDAAPNLPPSVTAAFADQLAKQELGEDATEEQIAELAPQKLRDAFDQFIEKALENADNPSFDELPRAIIAPHLDYARGWNNYGAVWGRMRVVDRPDRVIILGANHYGRSTGVCACDKGFETPLGVCEVDRDIVEKLRHRLGEALFEHRYDHEREHSVELQIAWIQHVLGADESGAYPKVFAALIHDPAANNGESYDGQGVGLMPFVETMKRIIDELDGRTLIVSSADLSHVGPAFGDQRPLAGDDPEANQARTRVISHDREMLDLVRQKKAEELVAAMAWQQNPTRWCSTGNLVATLKIVEPERVDVLSYAGAMDPQGAALVTSAAAAMW